MTRVLIDARDRGKADRQNPHTSARLRNSSFR